MKFISLNILLNAFFVSFLTCFALQLQGAAANPQIDPKQITEEQINEMSDAEFNDFMQHITSRHVEYVASRGNDLLAGIEYFQSMPHFPSNAFLKRALSWLRKQKQQEQKAEVEQATTVLRNWLDRVNRIEKPTFDALHITTATGTGYTFKRKENTNPWTSLQVDGNIIRFNTQMDMLLTWGANVEFLSLEMISLQQLSYFVDNWLKNERALLHLQQLEVSVRDIDDTKTMILADAIAAAKSARLNIGIQLKNN